MSEDTTRGRRIAMVIGLHPEHVDRYRDLHARPWKGVLGRITACNIRNYSIHLAEPKKGEFYLFSYFEYVGDDFDEDMKRMAADPETQLWWRETDPTQFPVETAREGDHWTELEEVFFHA